MEVPKTHSSLPSTTWATLCESHQMMPLGETARLRLADCRLMIWWLVACHLVVSGEGCSDTFGDTHVW